MNRKFISLIYILISFNATASLPFKMALSDHFTYRNNLYPTTEDKVGSFINSTYAYLVSQATVPYTSLKFSMESFAGYHNYQKNQVKNNYWDLFADLKVNNDTFLFTNKYEYTANPSGSEVSENAKHTLNMAHFDIRTKNTKLISFGATIHHIYAHYLDEIWNYLNRNHLIAAVQLYYNTSTKSHFLFEYGFYEAYFEDYKKNNSLGHIIGFGLEGPFLHTINLTGKIHYYSRHYKYDITGASENNNSMIGYSLESKWAPLDRINMEMSLKKSMEETLYGPNRFFIDTNVNFITKYKVTSRVLTELKLSYEKMDFKYKIDNIKRDDEIYTMELKTEYNLPFLGLGLKYKTINRKSDIPKYDYNDYRITSYINSFI